MSIGSLSTAAIIDLVLLGVLLIFIIVGTVRGLIKSVLNFAGTILAVIGAAILSGIFTPKAVELLYPHFQDRILNKLDLEAMGFGDLAGGATPLSGLFPTLNKSIQETVQAAGMSILTGVVRVVLFLLFFVICALLVKLLSSLLSGVFELPVLKSFNRLGGALFGLIQGMLILYMLIYLAPKIGITWLNDHSEGTLLLNFLINVSPLEWIDFLKLKSIELIPKKS
jgi:uncharacterized membrane protein required for colicin V production